MRDEDVTAYDEIENRYLAAVRPRDIIEAVSRI
jgi:hypothetical protein